jgi:hypothetical protein
MNQQSGYEENGRLAVGRKERREKRLETYHPPHTFPIIAP